MTLVGGGEESTDQHAEHDGRYHAYVAANVEERPNKEASERKFQ